MSGSGSARQCVGSFSSAEAAALCKARIELEPDGLTHVIVRKVLGKLVETTARAVEHEQAEEHWREAAAAAKEERRQARERQTAAREAREAEAAAAEAKKAEAIVTRCLHREIRLLAEELSLSEHTLQLALERSDVLVEVHCAAHRVRGVPVEVGRHNQGDRQATKFAGLDARLARAARRRRVHRLRAARGPGARARRGEQAVAADGGGGERRDGRRRAPEGLDAQERLTVGGAVADRPWDGAAAGRRSPSAAARWRRRRRSESRRHRRRHRLPTRAGRPRSTGWRCAIERLQG